MSSLHLQREVHCSDPPVTTKLLCFRQEFGVLYDMFRQTWPSSGNKHYARNT